MIEITDDGWEGLEGLGDELVEEHRGRAEGILKSALLLFEANVKERLTGTRSGRTRKVSKTGALHVASAPGEPPAVLFGNLRNSVGHDGPHWDGDVVEGTVGPGLGTKPSDPDHDPEAYARRLEFGGVDSRGVRILPRPYMQPSADEMEPIIERLFEEGI